MHILGMVAVVYCLDLPERHVFSISPTLDLCDHDMTREFHQRRGTDKSPPTWNYPPDHEADPSSQFPVYCIPGQPYLCRDPFNFISLTVSGLTNGRAE